MSNNPRTVSMSLPRSIAYLSTLARPDSISGITYGIFFFLILLLAPLLLDSLITYIRPRNTPFLSISSIITSTIRCSKYRRVNRRDSSLKGSAGLGG
jgi:hypothetical protein